MKYIFIIALTVIGILRFFKKRETGEKSNYLFVSLFIQVIPLGQDILRYQLLGAKITGTFDTNLTIDFSSFIILISLLLGIRPKKNIVISKYKLLFFLFLLFLTTLSFLNPINVEKIASFGILFSILQLLVLLIYFQLCLSEKDILLGLFDGLKIVILYQVFLTILYPIFDQKWATSLFHDKSIANWTERRLGYSSSIGTFLHPGALALFSALSLDFFFACYLFGLKKRQSILFTLICIFIIYFTFSRTSYLASIFSIFLMIFIFRAKSLFNLFITILLAFVIVYISFSMDSNFISNLFLKSDGQMQIESRKIHYFLAYEIWEKSKFIGIGINSQLSFMDKIGLGKYVGNFEEFFIKNPIHNIHLIVLAETGILGLVTWLMIIIGRVYVGINNIFSSNKVQGLMNLISSMVLITFSIYGFTGWSGFHREVYPIVFFLSWFLSFNRKKI